MMNVQLVNNLEGGHAENASMLFTFLLSDGWEKVKYGDSFSLRKGEFEIEFLSLLEFEKKTKQVSKLAATVMAEAFLAHKPQQLDIRKAIA